MRDIVPAFDITTGVALATDRYKVRQYVISVVGGEVRIIS